MKKAILTAIMIFVLTTLVYANITKTVEPNGNGDFLTIGEALSAFSNATDNWDILVWYDESNYTTYYENNLTWDASNYHIRLISTSDITATDFDEVAYNSLYDEEKCIIDADENGRIFEFINSHQTSDDVIYGFTLKNANTPEIGGALYYKREDDFPSGLIINHCIFDNNIALHSAGLYYEGNLPESNADNLIVANCIFSNNEMTYVEDDLVEKDWGDPAPIGRRSRYQPTPSTLWIFKTHIQMVNCWFNNNKFQTTNDIGWQAIASIGLYSPNMNTYGNITDIDFNNNYMTGFTYHTNNDILFNITLNHPTITSNVANIRTGDYSTHGDGDNFTTYIKIRDCINLHINNVEFGDNEYHPMRLLGVIPVLNNIVVDNIYATRFSSSQWDNQYYLTLKNSSIEHVRSTSFIKIISCDIMENSFDNSIFLMPAMYWGYCQQDIDVVIEDCRIYNNSRGGLATFSNEGKKLNLTVKRCQFYNNSEDGIVNFSIGGYYPQPKAGAISIDSPGDIIIENSTFVDNSYYNTANTNGLWFSEDFNPENFHAVNCIFWDDPGVSG
ncbi:MAG: hypothetical protein ACP5EQ_06420, partial [Candidatus Cloacimonadia bacterium]